MSPGFTFRNWDLQQKTSKLRVKAKSGKIRARFRFSTVFRKLFLSTKHTISPIFFVIAHECSAFAIFANFIVWSEPWVSHTLYGRAKSEPGFESLKPDLDPDYVCIHNTRTSGHCSLCDLRSLTSDDALRITTGFHGFCRFVVLCCTPISFLRNSKHSGHRKI